MMKIREPFSALSHLVGAALALPAVGLLLAWGGRTPTRQAALLVYGMSLFALFAASGVYHAAAVGPQATQALRKIDHSAIYLLIAGTYTPFCAIAFSGFWQGGMLAVIWGLAAVGILVKVFVIHAPRWVTAGVYVGMGWLSVFALPQIRLHLTGAAANWLLAGGILYTLGAVIYVTKKCDFSPGVFGFHEVWHIFVLLGAAAHFAAVAQIL